MRASNEVPRAGGEQQATTRLPLLGRRVLVTRPADQAGEFVESLRNLGAEPVLCPTIRIVPPEDTAPLRAAVDRMQGYDWIIFTSVNGVRFFFEGPGAGGRELGTGGQGLTSVDPRALESTRMRVAAIGPATAKALAERGFVPDFVPDQYVAEAIVAGIGEVQGQRILLPRADIARKTLVEGLTAKGAEVHDVTAYRTLLADPGHLKALLEQGPIDIATFTSPSTVHNFVALLEDRPAHAVLGEAVVACIGPITASAAQAEGLHVGVVATEHTTDGLLNAIVGYIEECERAL